MRRSWTAQANLFVVAHRVNGRLGPDDALASVKVLLAAGANATVYRGKYSALPLAGCKANLDIVRSMTQHGAGVNAPDDGGNRNVEQERCLLGQLWRHGRRSNRGRGERGCTRRRTRMDTSPHSCPPGPPIHVQWYDAVGNLLKHRAETSTLHKIGRFPLLLAMGRSFDEEPVLTALVVAGAYLFGSRHDYGHSTVNLAVRNFKDPNIWRAFIQRGVDVNTVVDGCTALHCASKCDDVDVLDALVDGVANLKPSMK